MQDGIDIEKRVHHGTKKPGPLTLADSIVQVGTVPKTNKSQFPLALAVKSPNNKFPLNSEPRKKKIRTGQHESKQWLSRPLLEAVQLSLSIRPAIPKDTLSLVVFKEIISTIKMQAEKKDVAPL